MIASQIGGERFGAMLNDLVFGIGTFGDRSLPDAEVTETTDKSTLNSSTLPAENKEKSEARWRHQT